MGDLNHIVERGRYYAVSAHNANFDFHGHSRSNLPPFNTYIVKEAWADNNDSQSALTWKQEVDHQSSHFLLRL